MESVNYFQEGGSAANGSENGEYTPMEGSQVNGGGTVDRLQKFYRGYFPPGTKERILEMISPKKALERRRERKAEEQRQKQMEELEKIWINEPEEDNRMIDYMEPGYDYGPLPEGVYEAAKGGNLKNGKDMAGKYGKGGYIEYFQTGGNTGQRDTTVTSGGGYENNGQSEEYACGGKASRKQYGGGLKSLEHSDGELEKVVKQADMLMKKAISNGEYDGERRRQMSPKFVWRDKLYKLIKDYPELYDRYEMENSGNY